MIHMVLCTRRSTRCGVVLLLSHDLSQVGSRSLWSRSWQTLCAADLGRCAACATGARAESRREADRGFASATDPGGGGCGRHVPHVLPHPHTRGLILSASDGIWKHVVLDLFSHFTVGKVQVRWSFVSWRGSRSPNSTFRPFASCEPHSCRRSQARLSVPTWQHVHRRVLRELDIEFDPTRQWTSSFFTACSYHGSSRRRAFKSSIRSEVAKHFAEFFLEVESNFEHVNLDSSTSVLRQLLLSFAHTAAAQNADSPQHRTAGWRFIDWNEVEQRELLEEAKRLLETGELFPRGTAEETASQRRT